MAERVRVLVELGGVLYTIGMIRSTSRTLALRRLGDRHADELGAFSRATASGYPPTTRPGIRVAQKDLLSGRRSDATSGLLGLSFRGIGLTPLSGHT
jgi:hypothetical protein